MSERTCTHPKPSRPVTPTKNDEFVYLGELCLCTAMQDVCGWGLPSSLVALQSQ